MEALLTWLDHGGVAVFAASGVLTAPRTQPVSHSRKETDMTRGVDLHELAGPVPPSSKVALPTEFAGAWRAMIRA